MRIAIVGAGAIGGMITALLANSGADPFLVARGKTLATLREQGITFVDGEERFTVYPRTGDDPIAAGPQGLVVIAVKAHQIEAALPTTLPLIGPETLVLTAINGVPWWFSQGFGNGDHDPVLRSIDPTGRLCASFDPARLIGCAVYLASEVLPPYTVESSGLQRLVSGTLSGETPERLQAVASVFERAGLEMPLVTDIRTEVMNKLMGNLWANPLSVVTGATMLEMTDDTGVRAVGRRMMEEFERICGALGIALSMSIDQRLVSATRLGAFRTSMLQDIDRGRPIELEAILGAVIEIAERLEQPAEMLRTAYALTRLRAVTDGCYLSPQTAVKPN